MISDWDLVLRSCNHIHHFPPLRPETCSDMFTVKTQSASPESEHLHLYLQIKPRKTGFEKTEVPSGVVKTSEKYQKIEKLLLNFNFHIK